MTEDQRELLEAAWESLAAAKHLLKGDFPAFAASPAYYAMFSVAQAFLEGDEMAFSKHSGTIAAFGQYFANGWAGAAAAAWSSHCRGEAEAHE